MRADGRKDGRDEAKSLSAILRTRLKETQNHIILTTGTALSTASQGLPPSDHAYTNSPNAMSVTIFTSHTLCFFYHYSKRRSRHRMSRLMQAFYATKLTLLRIRKSKTQYVFSNKFTILYLLFIWA